MDNIKKNVYGVNRFLFYGIIIIVFFSLLFSSQLKVYSFFMDDLAYWKLFKSSTFIKFIFNTYTFKFRPVANLFLYIGFFIIDFFNNTYLAEYIIIFFFSVTSVTIYYIFYRRSSSVVISISLTFLFIISRFSYYSVGQYFGIMEDLGIIFSILALDNLIYFYEKNTKYKSIIYIFLATFCHERYLSLFSVYIVFFILNFLFKNGKEDRRKCASNIFIATVSLISIILIRKFVLGNNDLSGTGGTNLLETIDIGRLAIFFVKGLVNILGLNWGEEYLYGISIKSMSYVIIIIALISILLLIMILINGLRKNKKKLSYNINFMTIVFFILISLFSGCITIRLEMRFLYLSYLGILYLLIFSINNKYCDDSFIFIKVKYLFLLFVILTSITNIYYRLYWDDIYFVRHQKFYNFLYSDIIKKYGTDINNRPIIFLEDMTINIHKDSITDFLSQYYDINKLQLLFLNNLSNAPKDIFFKNVIVILSNQRNANIHERDFVDITNSINLLNLH